MPLTKSDLQVGQSVMLCNATERIRAIVELASPNGISIALKLEEPQGFRPSSGGLVITSVVPLRFTDEGAWMDIWSSDVWTLEPR